MENSKSLINQYNQAANISTDLNSTIAIVDSGTLHIHDIDDFPVEDFFRVPFTHHIRIIEGTKDIKARYYYIHKTAEEHLQVDKLASLIKAFVGL